MEETASPEMNMLGLILIGIVILGAAIAITFIILEITPFEMIRRIYNRKYRKIRKRCYDVKEGPNGLNEISELLLEMLDQRFNRLSRKERRKLINYTNEIDLIILAERLWRSTIQHQERMTHIMKLTALIRHQVVSYSASDNEVTNDISALYEVRIENKIK